MAQIGVAQDAYDTAESEALTFRSPSLGFVCQHLSADRKYAVLDLGVPNGSSVDFFARVPCTLYVEDLFDSLLSLPHPDEEEGHSALDLRVDRCLAHSIDVRFDMVFAWDLVNYMQVDLVHSLMKRLSRSCRSGTLLYMMISTAPMIPDRPAKIAIIDHEHVRYDAAGPANKHNPRYTPLKLERMMPGFRLLHSFLLGASLQEYLFSFD